jgi:hypothetical protein
VEEDVGQGRDYLSVKLDDPSFPAPIYSSLVEGDGEELPLIWSRRALPTGQATSRAPRKGFSCPPPPRREYGELRSRCPDRRLKPPIEWGAKGSYPLLPANTACCGQGRGLAKRTIIDRFTVVIRSARPSPARARHVPSIPALSRPGRHVGDMPSALTGKDRTMNFISSSQNSQPVSGGFRVDISRGQRIGRVSSEWFRVRMMSVICRSPSFTTP